MSELAAPQQGSAPAQKQNPQQEIRGQLDKMAPEFQAALPEHVTVDKFKRVALTAINQNPDLAQVNRRTLFSALTQCAQDGLLPDGREAALVVFGGKQGKQAQYMPMLAGILKKVRNSGELSTISAHVIYENDEWDYELGDFERIKHKPALRNRGRPVAAYAIAHFKDGAVQREVMSVEEIEEVRQVSRSKDAGPWKSWWSEMARKTVIRRLAKRLPMSTEADQLIQHDEAVDTGKDRSAAAGATQPVLEAEEAAEAKPTAPQQPQSNGNGQGGRALVDENGQVIASGYKQAGSWLNALEKQMQQAAYPVALVQANEPTLQAIEAKGTHGQRIAAIREAAKPTQAPAEPEPEIKDADFTEEPPAPADDEPEPAGDDDTFF